MARLDEDPDTHAPSPVVLEMLRLDLGSKVALVGHPLHVMMVHFPVAFVIATLGVDVFYWWSGDPFWVRAGVWSSGFAFWSALAASFDRHGGTAVGARHPPAGGELVARDSGDDAACDCRRPLGRAPVQARARSCRTVSRWRRSPR